MIYETSNKRTSSVRFRRGAVVLKLSRHVKGRQRDEMVEKFLSWAQKKLEKVKVQAFLLPEYRPGGRIVTHNKVYDLEVQVCGGRRGRSLIKDDVISIVLTEGQDLEKLKDVVEKMIIKDQAAYLVEVLDELNQLHFQVDYKLCRWKRINSRFGSCSSTGNITIAYKLLFAPREVFRYVCVHELAHLKEFNHSKRFWACVEEAMPDYQESERWLKENGFLLG